VENVINFVPKPSKLAELRSKTDRELLSLISSRLELGLAFVRRAAQEATRANWPGAEELYRYAEGAYAEACSWMPLVATVTNLEHRRVEVKLADLHELLEEHSPLSSNQTQSACS
jgi:hypothetical protein